MRAAGGRAGEICCEDAAEPFQSSALPLFVSLFVPTQLVKKLSGLVLETEPISGRTCDLYFLLPSRVLFKLCQPNSM